MVFDFGANLRALRNEKGLTQEQAAELLDVSKQSVSRWETGITWPDISFLPRLASFYGVSVDALLGADEPLRRSLLAKYGEAHQAAHHRGDTAGAYELSRSLCARFPNERQAMSDHMHDAYLMGRKTEGPRAREYLNEALTAAERLSRMTEDLEEKCRCIRTSAFCCKLLGQPERAREWMQQLPGVWSGIELCAMEVLEGEELRDHLQSALSDFADILQKLIFAASELPEWSGGERRALLCKVPRLLELLFEEGDYGLFAAPLARAFGELADAADGQAERREYAEKALSAAGAFDALTAGVHSSLLFRGMTYAPTEATKIEPLPLREQLAQQLGFA